MSKNGEKVSEVFDSKSLFCEICKKNLLESFNEHFPDANDCAWDIIKEAIKNMKLPKQNCDKCDLYGECDHQGAYQKDGKWCYEGKKEVIEPLVDSTQQMEEEELKKEEMVDHPKHYNMGKFEVIDVIEDWKLGYHLGDALKYIARSPHKNNQIEDLRKAIWYIDRKIKKIRQLLECHNLERENRGEKKHYFVTYTKRIHSGKTIFCNDTIDEEPIQWIISKCERKENSAVTYNLVFYKEITKGDYRVFHPEP